MKKVTHNSIFVIIALISVGMSVVGALWWIAATTNWQWIWTALLAQPGYLKLFYGGLLLFLVVVPVGRWFERYIDR